MERNAPPIIVPCFDNDLSCPDARVTSDAASLIISWREEGRDERKTKGDHHRVGEKSRGFDIALLIIVTEGGKKKVFPIDIPSSR